MIGLHLRQVVKFYFHQFVLLEKIKVERMDFTKPCILSNVNIITILFINPVISFALKPELFIVM